jgi:ketosteroid isomerase-like protein
MTETPREAYLRFLELIGQDRWPELAARYAEDAVVDQMYARPEPVRIEGREALRARFAVANDLPIRLRPANVVIHDTADPEVIVAEFDYDVLLAATGERRLRAANVIVLRIRDGLIVTSRDYHDTTAIGAVVAAASG